MWTGNPITFEGNTVWRPLGLCSGLIFVPWASMPWAGYELHDLDSPTVFIRGLSWRLLASFLKHCLVRIFFFKEETLIFHFVFVFMFPDCYKLRVRGSEFIPSLGSSDPNFMFLGTRDEDMELWSESLHCVRFLCPSFFFHSYLYNHIYSVL